jgi:predicted TIM-barrel fold metal-dependent hydrolase
MAYRDFPVIDFHLHLPVPEPDRIARWQRLADDVGEKRAALLQQHAAMLHQEWRKAWGFPEMETEQYPAEVQVQRWSEELDKYEIEAAVFVTGGGNDTLGQALAKHRDRLFGFAHHEPFGAGAGDELRRCVQEYGFKGYKTLAPAHDRPIGDRATWPLWEACAELDVPALIHFGPLGAGGGTMAGPNISPLALHDVAKAFPDVNFVIPHFGCGYVRELLHLCWGCGNIYVDTSSSQQWARWMPGELTQKDLFHKYLETIGPGRLIFGTDSSWFPLGFVENYLENQIRDCRYLGVNDHDMRLIFHDNAARLLKLA